MPNLLQQPAPGERLVRFVGDRLRFSLRAGPSGSLPPGWRACLRTNLGRADVVRAEIIASVESQRPPTLAAWRDLPLPSHSDEWVAELPLAEAGWFEAKAYAVDPRGWQHWPDGPNVGLNVQPDWCRTANTIYCAWPRLFGATKTEAVTVDPTREKRLRLLDEQGYAVIPPSGKLRDLIRELPHIFDGLGCRILHLLPVNPTPTTYARFGRFGSPYAVGDLLAIDPALVEFDRRTTGVDQFRELTGAVHARGGRVLLDIVVNHTGWGSTLQENHPEWFQRGADGTFVSPGAWGVTWADLVELEHANPQLRRYLAEVLLEWCRRGVDGFRCDAGYMVPLAVWQYLTARVRAEFPDTVFLLEGLGGAWAATAALLGEGGLQWAYSELFQNYSGAQVATYLDHALVQSQHAGPLIHYSETHDNERLAARGRAWSQLRNRLCALTSVNGGFGFTCGVEWLAAERINVHSCRGLNWGSRDNLVAELARLNRLLADHPAFFDAAQLTRLSAADASVYALLRVSAEGRDAVLVLANTDMAKAGAFTLEPAALAAAGWNAPPSTDLLGPTPPAWEPEKTGFRLVLDPGAVVCLSATGEPQGLHGDAYRERRAAEAFALAVLRHHLSVEKIAPEILPELGAWVRNDPAGFLGAAAHLTSGVSATGLLAALRSAAGGFPCVVVWRVADRRRVIPVPPGHWLLVEGDASFRAALSVAGAARSTQAVSVRLGDHHFAAFPPRTTGADAWLQMERYVASEPELTAAVRFLAAGPALAGSLSFARPEVALLTNGTGGMARLRVDFGTIASKYDCLLGANLDPRVPVDRHVLAKRARVWVNADGFLSPLDADNLVAFEAGPPARWHFLAHGGDGRTAEIHLTAWMVPGQNTTVLRFARPAGTPSSGRDLPPTADVRLTVRVDIEDRSFHWETRRNGGAEFHFDNHVRTLDAVGENALAEIPRGFVFRPARDRQLRVFTGDGSYRSQPEWCEHIAHPVEASRGQTGSGDAFSPGWFELPLVKGAEATLVATAEPEEADARSGVRQSAAIQSVPSAAPRDSPPPDPLAEDPFAARLTESACAFVVRRDDAFTVVAGYPWFLDWGRDTLICARGLLAAGMREEVAGILRAFGRFERDGTLPNTIHGDDASNRDTSDAPLWFGVACEEFGPEIYRMPVDAAGRRIEDVLRSIAAGYVRGTPNGIRMDPESALIWSPSHFTWMDTNHPAGTPREGYPVEIQALWIRLLRQLERVGVAPVDEPWGVLADRAQAALDARFWLDDRGWFADVLLARPGQSAAEAVPDTALRSNGLFPIAFGLVRGERARRAVAAALQHLVVPGALRSLAPLPVTPPLPIHAADGRLLNDPDSPYWGRYEGDEDTRRKPAYHNGTAWVGTLPTFCEALAVAWDDSPAAVAAARAYLGSLDRLMMGGCAEQLPEIVDGDAPHTPRGCDAQAWSVTEALRVWRLLQERRGEKDGAEARIEG
jgi:predicted glycogen debranching enzyme